MSEIKVGDSVRLKSGGLEMVVEFLEENGAGNLVSAHLVWFAEDGSRLCRDNIVLPALVKSGD